MGVAGAVRLALRRELAALPDDEQRQALVDAAVAEAHARGRAVPVATAFEIDDVIDPEATRDTILAVLHAAEPPAPRPGRKRVLDPW